MLWSNYNNLSEMYNILSHCFEEHMKMHTRVYDIINLSYEEYVSLVNRCMASNPVETLQHFSLCLFVAWVTAYRLGTSDEYYKQIKEFLSRMPQHHARLALDAVNNACSDFQIDTFGKTMKSLKDIKRLAKIHAGYAEPEV